MSIFTEVSFIICSTWSTVKHGFTDKINPATPDTIGVANEVPPPVPNTPLAYANWTAYPGEEISTVVLCWWVVFGFPTILSWLSAEFIDVTEITWLKAEGYTKLFAPPHVPPFPAAAINTTPLLYTSSQTDCP